MLASFPDNPGRLRRAKSVSTVGQGSRPSIPDHVDPWVAQQQALLAATTAYERAYAGVSPTRLTAATQALPRTKSNTSRRSEGSHLAKRSSALRFLSDDHPRGNLVRRNTVQHSANKSNLMSGGLSYHATSNPISSCNSGPDLRAKLSMSTLATPTKSILSEPMRTGLRKARSMFYSSSRQTTDTNEDTASLTLIDACQTIEMPEQLTALPPYPLRSTPARLVEGLAATQDISIQDGPKMGVRERSSMIFTPFKKLQNIGSRKSSRTEAASFSFNSIRSTTTAQTTETTQGPVVKHKKSRSFSGGFKDKLMKVFRRNPSSAPLAMPAQQVDAKRHYYYNSTSADDKSSDGKSSRRNYHPSRPATPPFPRESSYIQPGKRQRSGGSDSSGSSNSKSRVTSWTDSTAGAKDPKRLSIIHEVSRPSLAMPIPTRPTTNSLLSKSVIEDSTTDDDSHSTHQSFLIEPKRVFSALMKEMARKDMELGEGTKVGIDEQGNVVASDIDILPSQSKRHSTSSGRNEFNRATIRTVSPEEATSLSRATSIRGQIRVPAIELPDMREESSGDEFPLEPADGCSLYAKSHRTSSSIGRIQRSQKANPPSAEQRAARVERATQRWRTTLDEGRRSLERSSHETLNALAVEHESRFADGTMLEDDPEEIATPRAVNHDIERDSADETPQPSREAIGNCVSPSIYSRNTDSPQSFHIDSVRDLPYAMHREGTGSAVIIKSHPVSSWVIGTPTLNKKADHSSKSSRDWTTWLSKEVAELEQLADSDITINDQWTLRSNGHRRERTQISEDDQGSVSSTAPSCMPKMMRPRVDSRSGSRPGSRMNERFPMIEKGRKSSSQSVKTVRSDRKKTPDVIGLVESAAVPRAVHSQENGPNRQPASPFPRFSRLSTASPRSVTVAQYTTSNGATRSTTDLPLTPSPGARARRLGRRISKAKSALELHNHYEGPEQHHRRNIRNAVTGAPLEGDTLCMILEGPYLQPHTSSPLKQNENSPIAGKFAEIGLDDTESVKSKRSETAGQRLADVFLRERKSGEVIRDDSLAFL